MAHNKLTACLFALAALVAACGGGDADAGADQAQTTTQVAAKARTVSAPDSAQLATAADSAGSEKQVLREAFAYSGGARDPFASLVNMNATGPELSNLQLVGVYLDVRSSDNSVAVFREKDSGKRYKLHEGDQLGRLQVAQIAARDVVFRIEDFGYERQETLSLRKQEDITP